MNAIKWNYDDYAILRHVPPGYGDRSDNISGLHEDPVGKFFCKGQYGQSYFCRQPGQAAQRGFCDGRHLHHRRNQSGGQFLVLHAGSAVQRRRFIGVCAQPQQARQPELLRRSRRSGG